MCCSLSISAIISLRASNRDNGKAKTRHSPQECNELMIPVESDRFKEVDGDGLIVKIN